MRVNNSVNGGIKEVYMGDLKAQGDHEYLAVIRWRGDKHIYLIKREGQRSWGAFALTDIDMEMAHIKGNSNSIMEEVLSNHSADSGETWKLYDINKKYDGKATLRKAIMELICYGTLEQTAFIIEKG